MATGELVTILAGVCVILTALSSGLAWLMKATVKSMTGDLITELTKVTTTLKHIDGRFDALVKQVKDLDESTQKNARSVAILKGRLERDEPVRKVPG